MITGHISRPESRREKNKNKLESFALFSHPQGAAVRHHDNQVMDRSVAEYFKSNTTLCRGHSLWLFSTFEAVASPFWTVSTATFTRTDQQSYYWVKHHLHWSPASRHTHTHNPGQGLCSHLALTLALRTIISIAEYPSFFVSLKKILMSKKQVKMSFFGPQLWNDHLRLCNTAEVTLVNIQVR